jgi:N-succinyldiaminopimelate aminotransferase
MDPVFASLPTTIFEEISTLARQHGAVNLGQGFPDGEGPEDVREAAARALMEGPNQYPPMMGLPALRQAVAEHYARFQGLDFSPEEVLVTSGATEALASALFALIAPGDEVVLIEPMYDAYLPLVLRAGGVPRFLTLAPPEWRLTEAAVERAVGPSTRLLVLNNPLNPAARVFDAEELALLARACARHDVTVVSDEVWEHVLFDGRTHRPIMAEPGMRERTVKIGSAGKIFSMTGWKVGWAVAAPGLVAAIARAHQYLTFTTPPNLQAGAAFGLAKDDAYFTVMRSDYARSRDRLQAALSAAGFAVLPSEGTYFLCVDLAASGVNAGDREFCLRAVAEAGVAAIPVSAFCKTAPGGSVIRLCFAKRDQVLDEAAERLSAARRLFSR